MQRSGVSPSDPSRSADCRKRNSTQSRTHLQHPLPSSLHSRTREHLPSILPRAPSVLSSHQPQSLSAATQQIAIYEQTYFVDLSDSQSVLQFLTSVEEHPSLSKSTSLSLQLLVLQKGLSLNKNLG
jgi:trans-aconitate methyltransferase